MAHRAETLRSIHRAMSECLLATSPQSLIPSKKFFPALLTLSLVTGSEGKISCIIDTE